MTQVPTYHDNRRGILTILAACVLFTVNDTLTKFAALLYPVGEVLMGRGLLCLILIGGSLVYAHKLQGLRGALTPIVLLRAVLDAFVNTTFVLALSHMRLADLTALNLASPLILTMMSAFFLRESVGWRRWSAILVGFVGMMMIVKPEPAAFNIWALAALATALGAATRDIVTRRIDPNVSTLGISFISTIATTALALVVALLIGEQWRPPSVELLWLLGAAAVLVSIGSTWAVAAFRHVDVLVVAPFRYSLLIWSGLAGYFIFGEVSDAFALAGATLIALSGLYTLHRERVRHRALSAKAAIH